MDSNVFGKREKVNITLQGISLDIEAARNKLRAQDYLAAMDIYEQLSEAYPAQAIDILAEVYDMYRLLPSRDRYTLYQSRRCNFGIKSGDKVLDIGSGHLPFPYATHLSDISTTDDHYGRDGAPFKHIDGKPVYEFNVENIPFADKQFDFVYCSHVLEHSEVPEKACNELMRIAKRGYIETPNKAKDLWLNCAKVSNHKWAVEIENDALVFNEYTPEQIEGLGCNILMSMHCSPKTKREKAFSSLIYLKPEFFNTMLLWEDKFEYGVKRVLDSQCSNESFARSKGAQEAEKIFTRQLQNTPDYAETAEDFKSMANFRNEQVALAGDTSKHLSINANNSGTAIAVPKANELKEEHISLPIQIVGSEYGRSSVVLDLIPYGSTVVSAGVGEDISFDLELIRLKGCNVIGIDPTEKSRRHVEQNKNERFHFMQKALCQEGVKTVKIYRNTNPDHVSDSITPHHRAVSECDFYESEAISIEDIVQNYQNISLLKLDIEGAEYPVLNSIADLEVAQVYIAFHGGITNHSVAETLSCIDRLKRMGYVMVHQVGNIETLIDILFVHKKYI